MSTAVAGTIPGHRSELHHNYRLNPARRTSFLQPIELAVEPGGVRVAGCQGVWRRANSGGTCDEDTSGVCETRPVSKAVACAYARGCAVVDGSRTPATPLSARLCPASRACVIDGLCDANVLSARCGSGRCWEPRRAFGFCRSREREPCIHKSALLPSRRSRRRPPGHGASPAGGESQLRRVAPSETRLHVRAYLGAGTAS